MFIVNEAEHQKGLHLHQLKLSLPPQEESTESAVVGVEGITVLMVSITTVIGLLFNDAPS